MRSVMEKTKKGFTISFQTRGVDIKTATEIYPDKLNPEDVLKDTYINWCKVNAIQGTNPEGKHLNLCKTNLNVYNRWNTRGGRE